MIHEVIFKENESVVRSYCNSVNVLFDKAAGEYLYSVDGERFLDFLSGSSALNYGHNDAYMKSRLIDYIAGDGLTLGLDLYHEAKRDFISVFKEKVLSPRGLDYRIQFVGPTGANAVEAALKLARKATSRPNVVAFTNAYHGCSMGALSVTGNNSYRKNWAGQLNNVHRVPFDGYQEGLDSAAFLQKLIDDPSSGVDNVAAIIFEGVQGEGGFNVASPEWAHSIAQVAKDNGILVIMDEIQTGCGRTGTFFSFESLGIVPDIVTLSKSISGLGLPMAIALIRPDLDIWQSGEHTGTFRGPAHAFVTASAALERYWSDTGLTDRVERHSDRIQFCLEGLVTNYGCRRKGRGMMQGLELSSGGVTTVVQKLCLQNNLIVETCGPDGRVVKLLPPLTITRQALDDGLEILEQAIHSACRDTRPGREKMAV